MAVFAISLFFIKSDSSVGRLYIWQVIFKNISKVPLSGYGGHSFQYYYSQWQAEYFSANEQWDKFHTLADSVKFAYNDFLENYIEFGFTSLICTLSLFVFLWYVKAKVVSRFQKALYASILSIVFFSLFTFPLRSAWILTLFITNLSLMGFLLTNLKVRFLLLIFPTFFLITTTISYIREKSYISEWNAVSYIPNFEPDKITEFDKLLPNFEKNSRFLYEYISLKMSTDSTFNPKPLLEKYKYYVNPYESSLMMGAYYKKNNSDSAIYYYDLATKIIPSRFIPNWELFNLYKSSKSIEKANQIATHIRLLS